MENKPCGCVEQVDGYWQQTCDCGNSGDLADVAAWCALANKDDELTTLRVENEKLERQLYDYQQDCAVIPEGQNVRSTVTSLRAQVSDFQQANHELDADNRALRAAISALQPSGLIEP